MYCSLRYIEFIKTTGRVVNSKVKWVIRKHLLSNRHLVIFLVDYFVFIVWGYALMKKEYSFTAAKVTAQQRQSRWVATEMSQNVFITPECHIMMRHVQVEGTISGVCLMVCVCMCVFVWGKKQEIYDTDRWPRLMGVLLSQLKWEIEGGRRIHITGTNFTLQYN